MEDRNHNRDLEVLNHLSKGNKFVFYLYQKMAKIASAIYIVTNLVKDEEPVKWQLRKVAVEALSLNNFQDEKSVFNIFEKRLLELEGVLEFARVAHVISEMNVRILNHEIRKVVSDMKERVKEGYYSPELVPSFFEVTRPSLVSLDDFIVKQSSRDEQSHKGHKGQVSGNDFYNPNRRSESVETKTRFGVKFSANQPEQKGQRRDQIIKIIKEKGVVTIKDITDSITDCSEKTIQRELISMVDRGELKKTGERRWSRYSVVV